MKNTNLFNLKRAITALLFFVAHSCIAVAQNPALPPDSCINTGAVFRHFEYDSNALRLYYQDNNIETVRTFSPDGNFVGIDTIHIDSATYYTIQNDSILVGKRLNVVVSEQTLPNYYWIHNHFVQVGIPIYGAVSVFKKDSFFYFLWRQDPVSATWNGKIWITKTDEQFLQVGILEVEQFQIFLGTHYFGIVADELIGLSYSTEGGQGWKYSKLILAGLDLTVKKVYNNSSNLPYVPGNGFSILPNKRFTYVMGLKGISFFQQTPLSFETQHAVVAGWENNMVIPISERVFNYKVEHGTPKKHFLKTEFLAHSDEGYTTQGKSDKILYANPMNITPNPAAGNYYAVDSLYCSTTLADSDSILFTRFSFLSCLGVVSMQSHSYALFDNGSIVDLNCASVSNLISSTPSPAASPARVFPNPAMEVLYIENAPADAVFRIKDISGRICLESKALGFSTQISIDALKSGLYLLEIEDTEHRQVSVYKIVKIAQ